MSYVSSDTEQYETQLLLAKMKALQPDTVHAVSVGEPRGRAVDEQHSRQTKVTNPRDLRAMVTKARKAMAEISNDPRMPLPLRDLAETVDDMFLGPPPSAEAVAQVKTIVNMLKEELQKN